MKKVSILLALLSGLALLSAESPSDLNALPAATPAPSAASAADTAATTAPAATLAPSASAAPAASVAPSAAPVASAAPVSVGTAESSRYSVISDNGQDDAALLSKTLEAYFDLYNAYFHFDESKLSAKLSVHAFANKDAFDAYLTQVLGETKDDFVYLHYNTLAKSQLLLYTKDQKDDYDLSLAHQAFVQYIKAFLPNTPLWIREGFAVYFEQSRYDAKSGKAIYSENLSWLETIKGFRADKKLIPVDGFLSMKSEDAYNQLEVFYPESWAFVSFLLQSDSKDSNRFLWDVVSRLSATESADAAQATVVTVAQKWPGLDNLAASFDSYLNGKKTFVELVTEGVGLYNQKSYDAAQKDFVAAQALNPMDYVPPYYLGLIAYYNKSYAVADTFYKKALDLGCDPGIANYALGVNAFAQGLLVDAKAYLTKAKDSSPDVYGPKADEVIARIK
jgi:tetratricopeptide (TPR) repeat protein